jgi:ribose transport system substrate-binding protein
MRSVGNRRGLGVLLAVLAVAAVACTSQAATNAPATAAPTAEATATAAPSAEPVRVGYISGGDSDPFVLLVTNGIRAEAKKANVVLSECDSQFDADKALTCARTLSANNLQSMVNWQFFPDSAPAICEAYGNLPTVAIDTPEKPCQKVFVGANNREAGLIAGKGLGDFAKTKFSCVYDAYISLDFPVIADVNAARAGGSKEGFENVCGAVPADKYFSVDTFAGGPDQNENSRRQVTDILTRLPNAKTILIIAPNSDGSALAALGAADVAGRKDQVWIVAHGADPSSLDVIRNEPQWIGDVAYFPEKYGELIVPLAISLAKGESVPEQSLITHIFINRDNIDQYYPKK